MAAQGFLLIASFLLVLLGLARPLGMWLARMINGLPLPGVQSLDAGLLRMLRIGTAEMGWRHYL
ncbi:MAG: potassium-transporting ATPase subunit KdpA, partial [Leclercia adecarboxylata]|nr:potassium-transporting ATPase subunit KdpA [Leclercia adecarboxylata]